MKKTLTPILLMLTVTVLLATSTFAANSGTHETNVTVLNSNDLTIVSVTPPTGANPSEYTTSTVTTTFVARSSNGASYINSSTAVCSYTKTGETTRTSASCTPTTINATDLNLSCDVTMQYYDAPSTWNINCSVYDNGLNYAENTTETFEYGSLTSMQLNYTGITFGSLLPGATADTGPNAVINTGNNAYSDLTVKAFNLTGVSDTSKQIPVTAFKADTTHGGIGSAIQLVENTEVSLGVTLPRGAIPTGTRDMWYYVTVPSVPPQDYRANGASAWVIAATP